MQITKPKLTNRRSHFSNNETFVKETKPKKRDEPFDLEAPAPPEKKPKREDTLPVILQNNMPFLLRAGVPNHLLDDYTETQYKICMEQIRPFQYQLSSRETKSISMSRQREWLAEMRELNFDFALFTGQNTDFSPNILALYLVHLEVRNQAPPNIKWINTTLHFHPPLKEEHNPALVVITNIGINSTEMKIDKVRDYLSMYACPKIVVVGGCDPIEFATKRLFKTPQYMLYFG